MTLVCPCVCVIPSIRLSVRPRDLVSATPPTSFIGLLEIDHLFGKELFIQFTVNVFRGRLSNFVCVFLFGTEGEMWDGIVLISDHCLSINFEQQHR